MISRRFFLKVLLAGTALYPFSKSLASENTERVLKMHNIHTDESVEIRYYASGVYNLESLERIKYFLRCHYTNEVKGIDIKLLDLLCSIKNVFGKDRRIQIISGYRSPAYNRYLISLGRNVSRNSLHLQGIAVDFAIPGIGNNKLFSAAKSFLAGGVGRYSNFIHIDTGRIRYW